MKYSFIIISIFFATYGISGNWFFLAKLKEKEEELTRIQAVSIELKSSNDMCYKELKGTTNSFGVCTSTLERCLKMAEELLVVTGEAK